MMLHCVAIVGDLVLADVFKSWKEIRWEAMHLLPAFYSWLTVSPLKRFLAKLDVKWQFDSFHHWVL